MGIIEKAGDILFDNVVGIPITPIADKIIEPIKETVEEEINKKRKRDIINEMLEYGLNFYENELFFDTFQKDFFNDKNLSFIYDSFFSVQSNEESNSPDNIVSHFYKPEHYDTAYRNSVKNAILDIVNKIHYIINKPTNHSERIMQNMIQSSTSRLETHIDTRLNDQDMKLNKILNYFEGKGENPNINISDFLISTNSEVSEAKPIIVDKCPKSITIYIYNKFHNIVSDVDSLLAFLEFSGQEQSFDVVKYMITYDDNTTKEEIIDSKVNDNILSFQLPNLDGLTNPTRVVITPPRTKYSISIETSEYDIVIPKYDVYFTRELVEDTIVTTWNDISENTNVIINLKAIFSKEDKKTRDFKFKINAKNPKDVYSQYNFYKVLKKFKLSNKIVFRDNLTHNILLETSAINVNISNEDLDYFIKLYSNALWVQDKYNIKLSVPKEVTYDEYVTIEMLKNVKDKKYYVFPNNLKISCIVQYDENYEKQNQIDEEKLYTAGYESQYIDVWDTRINFETDNPLHIAFKCANIEKKSEGIKVTSAGEIYAMIEDKKSITTQND